MQACYGWSPDRNHRYMRRRKQAAPSSSTTGLGSAVEPAPPSGPKSVGGAAEVHRMLRKATARRRTYGHANDNAATSKSQVLGARRRNAANGHTIDKGLPLRHGNVEESSLAPLRHPVACFQICVEFRRNTNGPPGWNRVSVGLVPNECQTCAAAARAEAQCPAIQSKKFIFTSAAANSRQSSRGPVGHTSVAQESGTYARKKGDSSCSVHYTNSVRDGRTLEAPRKQPDRGGDEEERTAKEGEPRESRCGASRATAMPTCFQ